MIFFVPFLFCWCSNWMEMPSTRSRNPSVYASSCCRVRCCPKILDPPFFLCVYIRDVEEMWSHRLVPNSHTQTNTHNTEIGIATSRYKLASSLKIFLLLLVTACHYYVRAMSSPKRTRSWLGDGLTSRKKDTKLFLSPPSTPTAADWSAKNAFSFRFLFFFHTGANGVE